MVELRPKCCIVHSVAQVGPQEYLPRARWRSGNEGRIGSGDDVPGFVGGSSESVHSVRDGLGEENVNVSTSKQTEITYEAH